MGSYVYQSSKSFEKKITLYNDNDSGNSSQCNDCVDYDLGVYYYLLLTQNSTTRYCQLLLQHHQISNKTITILFYEMLFLLSDIWVMYILQLWEDNFSNDMYSPGFFESAASLGVSALGAFVLIRIQKKFYVFYT